MQFSGDPKGLRVWVAECRSSGQLYLSWRTRATAPKSGRVGSRLTRALEFLIAVPGFSRPELGSNPRQRIWSLDEGKLRAAPESPRLHPGLITARAGRNGIAAGTYPRSFAPHRHLQAMVAPVPLREWTFLVRWHDPSLSLPLRDSRQLTPPGGSGEGLRPWSWTPREPPRTAFIQAAESGLQLWVPSYPESTDGRRENSGGG